MNWSDTSPAAGAFAFTGIGFRLLPPHGAGRYEWADLQSAFGFKLDLLTLDEVCLDLFFSKGSRLRVSECLPGWPALLRHLSTHFPSIPAAWELDVQQPPFATNLTLLFDCAGRTLQQAEAACYKS